MPGGDITSRDARFRVMAALVRHPEGLTRQELASVADVRPATLALMLRGRGEEDLHRVVVEAKARQAAPGGGPRPKIVRIRDGVCVVGVEIGHGHVRIGVAGLDGRLLPDTEGRYYDQVVMPVFRERRKTLNWIAGGAGTGSGALQRRLTDVFAARADSGEGSLEKPFVLGVGVSVAGPVDPSDGRLVCALPAHGQILSEEEGTIACADWDGESAGQGLRERLSGDDRAELHGWTLSRFRSASAAELCAEAELHGGALKNTDFAILVKWTGNVSAAVVLGGRIFVGSRGLAGGLPMHSPPPLSDGERDASGTEDERLPLGVAVGIKRLASEIAQELGLRRRRDDELLRDYFRHEVLEIVHSDGGRGGAGAAFVGERLGSAAALLGENLASTVDMLDLSKVVLGGGVFEQRDWALVAEPLLEGIRQNVTAPGRVPTVEVARHTDHPALDGAIASRLDVEEAVPVLLEACNAPAPVLAVAP